MTSKPPAPGSVPVLCAATCIWPGTPACRVDQRPCTCGAAQQYPAPRWAVPPTLQYHAAREARPACPAGLQLATLHPGIQCAHLGRTPKDRPRRLATAAQPPQRCTAPARSARPASTSSLKVGMRTSAGQASCEPRRLAAASTQARLRAAHGACMLLGCGVSGSQAPRQASPGGAWPHTEMTC